ncbi:MAG: hypothetical protein WA432_00785, partial [Candidatus Babeliaceae bacterium]
MNRSHLFLLLSVCLFMMKDVYAEEHRAPRPPFPILSQEAQDQEQLFPHPEGNIVQENIFKNVYPEEQRAPRPPFPIPSQEAQDQEQLFPRPEGNIFQESIFVEGNIIIQNNNNDANMYCLIFQKSRLGGKVQNNDEIGCIEFEGHDGFQNGAAIRSHVDGTPATGIVPGRIEFYTEPTTQGTAFERMRITGTGFIGIGTQAPFAELQLDNTSFGFSLQERGITPAGVGPFINLGSFVSGKYAYLIGTGSRLAIFDISNPNNPVAL